MEQYIRNVNIFLHVLTLGVHGHVILCTTPLYLFVPSRIGTVKLLSACPIEEMIKLSSVGVCRPSVYKEFLLKCNIIIVRNMV